MMQHVDIVYDSGVEVVSTRCNGVHAAMVENGPFLPGLSAVKGKPVQLGFDSVRLTSDAGVLVLTEIERRFGIAYRLARRLDDPRSPDRMRLGLAEMTRCRMLVIAAG